MDFLSSAIDCGLAALHASASAAAVYRRGGTEVTVAVTWGRSEIVDPSTGLVQLIKDCQDALIEDYDALLAIITVPRRGDEIEQDGAVRTVFPIEEDHCYRFSGHARQVLRVHTKKTE